MDYISSILNASTIGYTRKKGNMKYKDVNCKPKQLTSKNITRKKDHTCLDTKTLKIMKNIWNLRHPDAPIVSNNKATILKKLKTYTVNHCENELCIVENLVSDDKKYQKIKDEFYAPIAPSSWKKNINEWLSSIDIETVMHQYEEIYPEFEFLGPSPIDFDSKNSVSSICVWPEICNIDVNQLKKDGKTKIAFIFNTDPHYKSGSHWIAMYLDMQKKVLFFFDSNGDDIPKELKTLQDKIVCQMRDINIKIKSMSNENMRHQNGNTECGMYCLYFIISLLTNKHSFRYFKTKKIKDKDVEKLRKVYFNLL